MGALYIVLFGLVGAGLIILLAKAIVDANDGFSLGPSIGRGIASALDEASQPGGAFDQAIDRAVRGMAENRTAYVGDLTPTGFVWQVAFEFLRTDKTMPASAARDLAVETLSDFLRDEKIKFGDAAYAWDQSAARTIARECEIEYWDPTS